MIFRHLFKKKKLCARKSLYIDQIMLKSLEKKVTQTSFCFTGKYLTRFPVNFTLCGNFYGNVFVNGLFLRVFTVFSCKVTVNRKNYIKICVINFTVSLKKNNYFSIT